MTEIQAREQDRRDRFQAVLHGMDPPEPELQGPIDQASHGGEIVPENVTKGTTAWQRALALNAQRRRN
jgi:hypothetical protein